MDDPKLAELGAAIADGAAIDWSEVQARIVSDDPSLVTELRLVEQIARTHANLPAAADPAPTSASHAGRHTASASEPGTWGSLTLLEKVGRGTFGDVYKARDPRLDRPVALKLLRHCERDAAAESAVIEEARLMARVRHPNVVTVYGADRIDGRVGIWMEFVEGPTLEDELRRRGPFGADELMAIGVTLARAVDAVHRAGLVHRDLKAQNVMREADGRIVLGDFGAGRDLGDSGDVQTYDLAGTPLYLAPEVLNGGAASVQSDLYSLGVLLYHLSTGAFPVRGRSLRELRAAHATASRIPLGELNPALRGSLGALIDRAIDPDARRRPQTAREFEDALLHAGSFLPPDQAETGRTLARRLADHPLSAAEALAFAHQIAETLAVAHARGAVLGEFGLDSFVITPSGQLRMTDPAARASSAGSAPGRRYASPEQQRHQPASQLGDVWIFGCVCHELLTGHPPGEPGRDPDRQMDIGAIDERIPELARFLMRRCLQPDPHRRLASMTDARLLLEDAARLPAARAGRRSRAALIAIGASALVIAAGWAALQLPAVQSLVGPPPPSPEAGAVRRLAIPVNTGHLRGNEALAFSPDGSRLVFAVQEGKPPVSQLYLRSLDAFDATVIDGTTNGSRPFFSPDGQWVGFFAGDELKKVSLAGGPPLHVCNTTSSQWGGTWAFDGSLIFGSDQGLWRAPVGGGTPTLVVKTDPGLGTRSYRWPSALPDGSVLFTVWKGPLQSDVAQLRPDGRIVVVMENATKARYIATGHLIFGRQSSLLAVPFDPATAKAQGTPVAVLDHVRSDANGSLSYAVSSNGSLAYDSGSLMTASDRRLEWIDRRGRETPLPLPVRRYLNARISPDGQHVAVAIQEQVGDGIETGIWIGDPSRGTLTRLTTGGGTLNDLTWTRDSRRVTYRRARGGGLFSRLVDLSGPEEPLLSGARIPSDDSAGEWSPDGQTLIFSGQDEAGKTGFDLWMMTPQRGTMELRPLVRTRFDEFGGVFSPDGQWIAYVAKDSGRAEVYVRPFAGAGPVVQISNGGGQAPHWRGRELIYEQPNPDRLFGVDTSGGPSFQPGRPRPLFDVKAGQTFLTVSPDGQRFLFLYSFGWSDTLPGNTDQFRVVINWIADLQQHAKPKT